MSIGRRSFTCLVLPALASACSSSDPVLYTLPVKPGPQFPKSPAVVQVRDIGLARYLDRREIVRSSADYKLNVSNNDWWGEQLGGMLSRVIVLGLSQRLPSSSVYAEGGAISADPNATLALNIQRLEPDTSGANVAAWPLVSEPRLDSFRAMDLKPRHLWQKLSATGAEPAMH